MDRTAITSGQIGCPENEVVIRNEGSGWNSETWTAECRGRKFYCSSVASGKASQASCHEEVARQSIDGESTPMPTPRPATRAPSTTEPPTGIGGFRFGSDAAAAQAKCEAAGAEWKQSSTADHFTCSSLPISVGTPVEPVIRFCEGQLCAIKLHFEPTDGFLRSFNHLSDTITKKYGIATAQNASIPSACQTEAQFRACVARGAARAYRVWRWDDGERIEFKLAATDEQPFMELVYIRVETSQSDAL
ncbi:MAG: hypothetical protein QM756_04785 [Polyangiaceae bacterium]